MSIKLKGSVNGSVSLDVPGTLGSDHTLTLPNGVGSANQYLRNSGTAGTLEFGDLPTSGKLLKMQTLENDVYAANNTGNWNDALTFSYTPVSATSTLHFILSPSILPHWNSQHISARLIWNSNVITTLDNFTETSSSIGSWFSSGFSLHGSATSGVTSATNFQFQMLVAAGSQYWYVNYGATGETKSFLTVFEVAA